MTNTDLPQNLPGLVPHRRSPGLSNEKFPSIPVMSAASDGDGEQGSVDQPTAMSLFDPAGPGIPLSEEQLCCGCSQGLTASHDRCHICKVPACASCVALIKSAGGRARCIAIPGERKESASWGARGSPLRLSVSVALAGTGWTAGHVIESSRVSLLIRTNDGVVHVSKEHRCRVKMVRGNEDVATAAGPFRNKQRLVS